MSREDAQRWDARYADPGPDVIPAPPDAITAAGLVDRVPTSGRALDVACGRGAQTVWMAQRGLDVTAIDASPAAIRYLTTHAQSIDRRLDRHLDDRVHFAHRIDARVHDLDDGLPDDATDLDVIVCQRFRDPSLFPQFVERLAPGGLLIVTVLSRTGASSSGPFHAPPGELRTAFTRDDCTILHHTEADGQESVIARRRDDAPLT